MADAKSQAIAREQEAIERAEREDGILKTMRRIERKLDLLLDAQVNGEVLDTSNENQVPLEVSKEELPDTPTIVPVTAADDTGDKQPADDKKAADEKKADKPKK